MKFLNNMLFRPAHPASLGLFRFLYGIICLVHLTDQWRYIRINFIDPRFHFAYPGLEWIQPLPGWGMYAVHAVLFICAVGILLGIGFRKFLTLFLSLYLYVFLIDAAHDKTHYYLTFLTGVLLWITPANYCFVFRAPEQPPVCFSWHIYLIRFQFCVVYFYAGLAKLNGGWWYREPVMPLMRGPAAVANSSIFAPFYGYDILTNTIIYGGACFDLLVPFFLCSRATRKYAAMVAVFFYSCNHMMFPNSLILPILTMFSLVVFFDSDWPTRNRFLKYYCKVKPLPESEPSPRQKKWVPILLGAYAMIQIALPLQHHLYPGDILRPSQGDRFARQMIRERERARLMMDVGDPRTSVIPNARVIAENGHSINGRDFQLRIKADVDLAQIPNN